MVVPIAVGAVMYRRVRNFRLESSAPDETEALCRSCRRLRSFALDPQKQDQKIAAFGSSYRGFLGSEKSQQGGDDGFRSVFLDEVAGVGDWVEL